jgi:hypothetical protein
MTTTNTTTTHDLLFLLAAAPLGLGCIIVTDDTDDTAADTGNQTSTGSTSVADTGTDSTPVTDEGTGTGTGTGGTADSGESTRGESSSGGVDDSTTGGGAAGNCADYGAHAIECALPYSEYAETNCDYYLEYNTSFSGECGTLYEEYLACLTALSCEELGGDAPCTAQFDALLELGCPASE